VMAEVVKPAEWLQQPRHSARGVRPAPGGGLLSLGVILAWAVRPPAAEVSHAQ
jgi:hypothetical protein